MTFLKSLPKKASEKIAYNISKSMIFTDSDPFKKLDGTDIWEFRTQYNGILGHRRGYFGHCHSRIYKEEPEDAC